MRLPLPLGRTHIAFAALLLAPVLSAAQTAPVTTVYFAPAVNAKMQQYGAAERAKLQSAIVAAVSREARRGAIPAGLAVAVTLQDVAPTRPTMKQQTDNPTLDPVHTKYLGGAALIGEVRDASQHVLARATYRYFPGVLPAGSVSLDPWADARLAIDQFAVKLAAACRNLTTCRNAGAG